MKAAASHNGTAAMAMVRRAEIVGGPMPTLFRFVTILAVLAGLAYGAMYALAVLVEPNTGEMTVRIPQERLNPQR